MTNLMVIFIFFCFRLEVSFFLEICSINQNCLLKMKSRTQINSKIQNLMVILILFQIRNFLCGLISSKKSKLSVVKIVNCQFKLKIGTQTNSNMMNLMVIFIFSVFDRKHSFFLEICSINQNCLLKMKFRTWINSNMQSLMVNLILFQI